MNPDTEFAAYAEAAWPTLVRSAVFLGCRLPEAEDLAQTALTRCYAAWAKVRAADNRDAYVYRVLVNCLRDSRRRRWWGEHATADLPEGGRDDQRRDPNAMNDLERLWDELPVGPAPVSAILGGGRVALPPARRRAPRPLVRTALVGTVAAAFVAGTMIGRGPGAWTGRSRHPVARRRRSRPRRSTATSSRPPRATRCSSTTSGARSSWSGPTGGRTPTTTTTGPAARSPGARPGTSTRGPWPDSGRPRPRGCRAARPAPTSRREGSTSPTA